MVIIARYANFCYTESVNSAEWGCFKHLGPGSGDNSAHFQTENRSVRSETKRDLEREALLTLTSAHLPNAENKRQMQLPQSLSSEMCGGRGHQGLLPDMRLWHTGDTFRL